jgi:hypothetical protein
MCLLPPLSPLLLSAPMKLDSLLWWIPNFGIYACATSELSCWREDSWAHSPASSLHSGQEHGSCIPKRWAHLAVYWVSTNMSHSRHHSKYIHPMCSCLLKLKPTICKLQPNNTNLFFCFVTNANSVLAGSNTQNLWFAALILTFPRAAMLITATLPPIER